VVALDKLKGHDSWPTLFCAAPLGVDRKATEKLTCGIQIGAELIVGRSARNRTRFYSAPTKSAKLEFSLARIPISLFSNTVTKFEQNE
jgi:hypothetical protein